MEDIVFLPSILVLMASAIFIVMIFKKLRLSPVLGYLVTGGIIGDHGLGLVSAEDTYIMAEFGVVFLLFAIGLELSFERLNAMRKYVFGLGSLQVVITAATICGIAMLLTGNSNMALIIGGGLALSSTAIVLQILQEKNSQSNQVGRVSLAILLQQDFTVVPLLVIVPLLASDGDGSIVYSISLIFLKAILALFAIICVGRLVLRPLFNFISSESVHTNNEIFIAATLLIALSAAWITNYIGLSMALGAFIAGVLVAETEFRVTAEESIAPFKGLLLGLFFMSVGMNISVPALLHDLNTIFACLFGLIAIKTAIIAGLCLLFGFNKSTALRIGLLLSQGSEFAFILFKLGLEHHLIPEDTGKILLLVVTFSMALTPILSALGEKLTTKPKTAALPSSFEVLKVSASDLTNHIIVVGCGTTGRMVSRMLQAENVNYIVVENNDAVIQDNGTTFPVFKGDAVEPSILEAAGIERASGIILTVDNEPTTRKILKVVSTNFPDVITIVRIPNLKSATELYDLGATIIVPEDYETGLQLGGAALKELGVSDYEISRVKNLFRTGNYVNAIEDDEDLVYGENL